MDIATYSLYNLVTTTKRKELFSMLNSYYINDVLKVLDLFDICASFYPHPYPNSDSCFRFEIVSHGSSTLDTEPKEYTDAHS